MKIAYYLPSLQAPGGLERIITFKANYFADQMGYEIFIITSEQMGNPPHFPLSPKVKHIDLGISFDLPYDQSRILKLIKYPFRYFRFKKRFSHALKEIRPDITISTLRRELNFINELKDGSIKIGEFHVTRYSYGSEARSSNNHIPDFLRKKWAASFVKQLSKLSRFVILTHEGAKDWPELNNITVIPNPISTPIADRYSNVEKPQAIAVGRYVPQKGFDMLIDAWALVTKKHPNWTLRIYGEGMLHDELQQQIENLGLQKICILEHTVPNIADKYCESSIYILSSRFEGLPLVLGECMTYGVPPVAFECPCGPRDMITDGVNGVLVENGNIIQLADKICNLIENEFIRKQMSQEAIKRAKNFQIEYIAQQWKELFESLINPKY